MCVQLLSQELPLRLQRIITIFKENPFGLSQPRLPINARLSIAGDMSLSSFIGFVDRLHQCIRKCSFVFCAPIRVDDALGHFGRDVDSDAFRR